jgi:hypothetical protein
MNDFRVHTKWLRAKARNALEATMCELKIELNNKNVTFYRSDEDGSSDHLELPIYYLAEWFAENWWSILWEPRKSEDSGQQDDGEFMSRHSLLAAQHGFHLPEIIIVSNGPCINITAIARNAPFADVRFVNRAQAFLTRTSVESTIREFVGGAVERLEAANVQNTPLQISWHAVTETDPGTFPYCEMLGALGLSPYDDNSEVDRILDRMCDLLGEAYTRDLCMVAKPEDFEATARAAQIAVSALSSSADADISVIASLPPPRDNFATKAWYRGKRAAVTLRDRLSISDRDMMGADKLFDIVQFDPAIRASIGDSDFQPEGAAIVGAVHRDGNAAKISCIQKTREQRRFTASRAIFSAWTGKARGGHLLTQAVTRHQQASRAFAAELLAPMSYISQWRKGRSITYDDVTEISQNLKVGADVVYKQALNNGLAVLKA